MLKKLGVALLLAFLVLIAGINVQISMTQQVYACSSVSECREQAREATNNLANMESEQDGLVDDLAGIQTEITGTRNEIATVEIRIRALVDEVDSLEIEIAELLDEVTKTREIIRSTDDRIDDLVELIARRMRATQRFNNRQSTLAQLSAAENLNDFVQIIRYAQRAANNDVALMTELAELIELNQELYEDLTASAQRLEEQTEQLLELQVIEEAERTALQASQRQLLEYEQRLQDQMDMLYEQMQSEEERLRMIQEMQEVLERSVQPPSQTGLHHPMPGARVTSEFGPRWGTHHSGIDLAVAGDIRAPILASAAGIVTLAEWSNSFGWWVIISHNINGYQVDTVYAHLRYNPPVAPGDLVAQGEIIGIKGNTGQSRGAHLHFEVHPGGFRFGVPRGVDPRTWVNF